MSWYEIGWYDGYYGVEYNPPCDPKEAISYMYDYEDGEYDFEEDYYGVINKQ